MQQRMLKNLAFFGRNKIAKSLQTALNGGNRKFNLYFDRNEINIIDLANKRFLYPKGAFVSVAQNIAQTPLNNNKWKIYANNLRLAKIENRAESATIRAMNEIVDIAKNSSLGAPFALGENFGEQQTPSLVLSPKFSPNTKLPPQNTRIVDSNQGDSSKSTPFRHTERSEVSKSRESKAKSESMTQKRINESHRFAQSKRIVGNSQVAKMDSSLHGSRRFAQNDEFVDYHESTNPPQKQSKGLRCCFGLFSRETSEIGLGRPSSEVLRENNSNEYPKPNCKQDAFATNDFAYHLPPLFLPQTNIFGLCGGLFLDILVENGYFFHSLLIYEEEAELFALSCYFVDYERLFSRTSPKSCYIFIENLLDKGLLNHYFYSKKITNNFLRLELSLLKSPKTRDFKALTFETYKANARGWGSFEDEMVGLKNTFANAKNAPFLRIDSKLKTPICVVGSGPSLESNINFIRANQNKMLIFSCGTALKVLKKHKIAIDFQIEIERVPYLAEVLQSSNLDETAVLCASLVNPKVLEVAQSAILFMRGGSASSYIFGDTTQEIAPLEFCAPFVGNAGFSLACALSDEVIMCGMDCGFIKGFAKHSSGSIYGDESAEIPRDCFKVEGNCSDFEVFSNAIFSLSKESFALSIAHYKPKIVHNLSFGAKIKGAHFTQNLSLKNRAKKMPLNSRFVEKTAIDSAKQSLKDSALKFIDELKNALNYDDSKPISTKQELFCYIDSITDFLAKISEKNPKIGILFEGSISHLLQSAMIALLSVKKNAISAEFEACNAVILGACEAYKREIGDL